MQDIQQQFHEAAEVLQRFISDPENFIKIEQAALLLSNAFQNGHKAYSCGNGGSMCDAMHFAEELSGRFRNDRPALPAVAIADPSYLSCVANDLGFENVFSRFLEGFGQEGDVLLSISTSGNSTNVVKAMETAKQKDMKVIALTGKDGGRMAALADVEIRAPHSSYADRAQEIHIKVIHALIHRIEQHLFQI